MWYLQLVAFAYFLAAFFNMFRVWYETGMYLGPVGWRFKWNWNMQSFAYLVMTAILLFLTIFAT